MDTKSPMLWVGIGGGLLVLFLLMRKPAASTTSTMPQGLPVYNSGNLNPWSDSMPDLGGTGIQYNAPITGGAVGSNTAPYQFQNIVYGPIDPALRAQGYLGTPVQSYALT